MNMNYFDRYVIYVSGRTFCHKWIETASSIFIALRSQHTLTFDQTIKNKETRDAYMMPTETQKMKKKHTAKIKSANKQKYGKT